MTRWSNIIISSSIAAILLTGQAAGEEASGKRPKWNVVVVAHRGMAPGYPENTLLAFRHAFELGVDYIEVDLRMTKDGVPVILHDDTLDRTTDGKGEVSELTLAEIKKLDAGSIAKPEFAGARIPTLEETLALAAPLGGKLILDIKSSSDLDCEKVVRLVERYHAVADVIVGARSVADIQLFRSFNPRLRTLGLVPGVTDIKKFVKADVDIIRLWLRWIRMHPPLIGQVRKYGKPLWVTAGPAGREELSELISLGADGILTDLPEVLRTLLATNPSDLTPPDKRTPPR